jgi:hypothetical protein
MLRQTFAASAGVTGFIALIAILGQRRCQPHRSLRSIKLARQRTTESQAGAGPCDGQCDGLPSR